VRQDGKGLKEKTKITVDKEKEDGILFLISKK